MTIALLTGSMNPFTTGHKHVVDMGLHIFDKVVIGIGHNPDKDYSNELFTFEQRLRMTQQCVAEHGDRVEVAAFEGAAVDFANDLNATAIMRGIRDDMDHNYEASMSYANNLMLEVEHKRVIPTIYVPCPPMLTQISSSRVRELVGLRRGIDVLRHFVLPPVAEVISEEIYKRKTGS